MDAVIDGFTSQTADVVLNTAKLVANMTSMPGVPAVPIAVKLAQDKLKYSKVRQRECIDLAQKCGALLQAYEEHLEKIKDTELSAPVNDCIVVLEQIISSVATISKYPLWKLILKDDDIKDELKSLGAMVDVQRKRLSGEEHASLHKKIKEMKDAQQKQDALTSHMAQLLREYANGTKQLSDNETQDLLQQGHHVVEQLTEASRQPDSDLNVDGFEISRAQFNLLFEDVVKAIQQLKLQTGLRPSVTDLGAAVHVPSNYKGERAPVAANQWATIYTGTYLGERVAVKEFRSFSRTADKAKKRFLNELKVWSILNHPHIHSFLGVTDKVLPYIALVSSWEENGNIMTYTKAHQRADRHHLLAGAAEGMIYLQEKNIVHGNLKGSNILISDEGEALITDFQVAKVLIAAGNEYNLATQTVTRGPIPRWSAPELANANVPTFKSDVWSFGMVMLEVFTGEVPFPKMRRDIQIIYAVSNEGVRPSRPEDRKWITDDVWALMQSCWATEPEERTEIARVFEGLREAEEVRKNRPREATQTNAIMRSVLGYDEGEYDEDDGPITLHL